MEKLLEQITTEYDRFNFSKPENIDDSMRWIYKRQEDINGYVQSLEYQKGINRRSFSISRVLVHIPFIKVYKTPDFFEEDSMDMELGTAISTDYLGYYNRLLSSITHDNYVEISKLAGFIGDLYNYNIRQLEGNRAIRERIYYGEEEFGVCELISKELVDDFFDTKISSIIKSDKLEKVKK